jgi:hypothetical protein
MRSIGAAVAREREGWRTIDRGARASRSQMGASARAHGVAGVSAPFALAVYEKAQYDCILAKKKAAAIEPLTLIAHQIAHKRRVELGGHPTRPTTDPALPVKGIRLVTLWRCPFHDPSACGDTLMRPGVLRVVPASGPQRGIPFAPRGPVGPVPPLLRGSITQRLILLSTLRSDGRPAPRKTRFPALPDGIGYPQGFSERLHIFEMILLSRVTWRNVCRSPIGRARLCPTFSRACGRA